MELDGKSYRIEFMMGMMGGLCAFGAMLTGKKIAGKIALHRIKKEIKEYEKNKQELNYKEKEKMLRNIINRINDMLAESNLFKEEKRGLKMLKYHCQDELLSLDY